QHELAAQQDLVVERLGAMPTRLRTLRRRRQRDEVEAAAAERWLELRRVGRHQRLRLSGQPRTERLIAGRLVKARERAGGDAVVADDVGLPLVVVPGDHPPDAARQRDA